MTGGLQSSVQAVFASERAAHLQTVIELVPQTIAYLQIPLTPARAAKLADFIARTGIGAQALVLDLLDDAIFDVALSDGGKSCVPCTSNYPQSSAESSAICCEAPQDFADQRISAEHGRGYSRSSPPKLSPISPAVASEQPNTNSPATNTLPHSQSALSSISASRHGNEADA